VRARSGIPGDVGILAGCDGIWHWMPATGPSLAEIPSAQQRSGNVAVVWPAGFVLGMSEFSLESPWAASVGLSVLARSGCGARTAAGRVERLGVLAVASFNGQAVGVTGFAPRTNATVRAAEKGWPCLQAIGIPTSSIEFAVPLWAEFHVRAKFLNKRGPAESASSRLRSRRT